MVRHAERELWRRDDERLRRDAPQPPPAAAGILSLQRSLGNAAVSAILARNGSGKGDNVPAGGSPSPKVPTGLAAAAPTAAFATSAVDFATRNPGNSFEDLVKAVFEEVEQLLRGIGSHPPELRFADAGALGLFRRDQWALVINRYGDNGKLKGKTLGELGPAVLGDAADTIYHEARHSEQFFRIARMLFGKGENKYRIRADTSIPMEVLDLAAAQPLRGEDDHSRQLIEEAEDWHDITVGRFKKYEQGVKDLMRRDTLAVADALSEAEDLDARTERFGDLLIEYELMKAPIEKVEDDLAKDKVPATIMRPGAKLLKAYDDFKFWVNGVANGRLVLTDKVAQRVSDCAATLQESVKDAYKTFAHEVDAFSVGGAASAAVVSGMETAAGNAAKPQLEAAAS